MIWATEKKVVYHILDVGFESVGIPVRVKFEFEVLEGAYVADSLTCETLYNQKAVAKRYPNVRTDLLELEIQKTVQREIRKYMIKCGYLPADSGPGP
jgi:hypothetical protein